MTERASLSSERTFPESSTPYPATRVTVDTVITVNRHFIDLSCFK